MLAHTRKESNLPNSDAVPYRHVIWDWNGTLLDDAGLCIEAINLVLRRRNLAEIRADEYAELFDFPVERYYRRLPFDWARESFEQVGSEFMEIYEARRLECRLREGAREALARFRARGARQHLISGYRREPLVELIRHFGLEPFFDEILGAEDIYARGKLNLAERWRTGRDDGDGPRLVIGDTVHDFEMARLLGAACILLPCGHMSRRRLEACGARVAASLDDV